MMARNTRTVTAEEQEALLNAVVEEEWQDKGGSDTPTTITIIIAIAVLAFAFGALF